MRRQTPSLRELTTEIVASAESEGSDQELQSLLVAHSRVLSETLGAAPDELARILDFAQPSRGQKVRDMVRASQAQRAVAHQHAMSNLARAAATMLAGLARFHEGRVELDARIVMGSVLADRSVKFVEFVADGYEPVAVSRAKLREAKQALTFPNVRCFLDRKGLHFGWREGRGGLTLWPRDISREASERVLTVPISRPAPVAVQPHFEPRQGRAYWCPSLIGDVLTDLGFL